MLQISPQASVIIPAYGVARWIGQAVQSSVEQDLGAQEVIVVNDGSPDALDMAAALAPWRDRVTYLDLPNRGVGAARNAGLEVARGEWVAFLDGDDWWEPGFLSTQLRFLADRRLDLAWSDGWVTGETLEAGRRIFELRPCRGPVTVEALINQSVSVGTSATVVRRTAVVAAGGFDPKLRRGQDFDLWVRLVHAGARAGYNPAPLIHYRVRAGNLSGDSVGQATRALEVMEQLRSKLAGAPRLVALLDARLTAIRAAAAVERGKAALEGGHFRTARAEFRAAFGHRPTLRHGALAALALAAPALAGRWLRRRARRSLP